ncbi:MAG TPA: ATP-dependent DNA helicase, partial [Actinomycetota bacterium]|nr:ATP-dependent DNA helicase [Actinomycetota bacterium]
EHPEVAKQYRDRFDVVLLDEYQDTNVAQARLMAGVFGGGHAVTAVGDPDQNIYAWRGASLFNLLEFPRQFRRVDGSEAPKLPLYTNFRSGAWILEAADVLIGELPSQQRPDPDKRLVPWIENGTGQVHVARISDEVQEAAWVADRIVALHERGAAWSDCAVLCRTSRLFLSLQQAFAERGVPAEILGLAGLLKMPEVVEVLAYARATLDPMASVALGRILLGPRYRVGFRDLALVASLAKTRNLQLREEHGNEEDPFLFAEALEHLDEVEGLSPEGRARLEECRQELAELRVEARRPVGEFLGEIVRRTGILTELDAHLDVAAAASARRNLAAFLDEVHAFAPVRGELTLRAFLEYVDTVERLDKQEWSPVQPSEDDSVKVMTIHVAKGLEFDHVFVPGLAKGLLPNMTIQHNPAERGKSMDFELRGDAAYLPRYDGNLSAFKKDLQQQEVYEERRTAYVAMTRARRTLHVTGAHWYGENLRAKEAGPFLRELKDWVIETKHATWDPGADIDEEHNPILGYRERLVRDWPGPDVPDESDRVFPQGWRRAAVEAFGDGIQASLLEELEPTERERLEHLAADRRGLAQHLRERESHDGIVTAAESPATVSVGGVIDYARCPKRFYWTSVRPLPRFSGPAARIGTEVHRWIERRSAGQGQLLELDDAPDLTAEELASEPGRIERLRQAFLSSRFADRVPLFAEREFILRLDGFAVAGRIDAVFGDDVTGPWEVVDWKTGRPPAEGDPLAGLQLDLYGLACVEVWGKGSEDLTLTYLYLGAGEERSNPMGDPDEVRARVSRSLTSIGTGAFDPTPGTWCHHCDFLSFCDAGRAWVAAEA